MIRCALPALAALCIAAPAASQSMRPFPANALRGTLVVLQPPDIAINDQAARLSPGARIRGDNNMLLLSGALVGQKLVVNYTLESHGLVHDVWILRPDEMARQPWPKTPEQAQRWSFDRDAQVWTQR